MGGALGRDVGSRWRRADQLAERVRAVALAQTQRGDSLHDAIRVRWPVDVHAIASALGVLVDDHADIDEDGLLLATAQGWRVRIRHGTPAVRARFTLAHELMHIALSCDAIGGEPAREAVDPARGFRSEERLCDCAAAALLLPETELRRADDLARTTVGLGHCARTIFAASSSETSLAATFVRLHDLYDWNSVLYHWTHGRRGWYVQTEAGLDPAVLRPLRFGDALPSWLNENSVHRSGSQLQRVWLPIASWHGDRWIAATARIGTSAVTAVVDPAAPTRAYPQDDLANLHSAQAAV